MSETPDYTEAKFVVKHTSKIEKLFSLQLFQFPERQICILYVEIHFVKAVQRLEALKLSHHLSPALPTIISNSNDLSNNMLEFDRAG